MLKSIFKDITSSGGKAYIVGGYVRDKILNVESKDVDIEVYGITPQELKNILQNYGRIRLVGKSYPIYLLEDYEFSFPHKTEVGVKGEHYKVDPKMTIEEACARRDLTINSMLYDPLKDEIIDIYGGQEDLKKGILRYISPESFQVDPLRILRVAQFKARFDFQVDEETE
ncbi:CCA tRNA nucleotidyltransferase [Orenia marismortui]|uniref:Poly(A) polymerase-like protein n=1 Tax=Orenia marismortui TaxID=46469 RepID=A0A4R8GZF5_9FIRM|nr:CCA tRNA nucleotidyltransferase [Orenia marismortui]TDX52127.1 poly(A) polymerase-like protein [Orenia marismortui]